MASSTIDSAETPLLSGSRQSVVTQNDSSEVSRSNTPTPDGLSLAIKKRLYISHFLSTWNSRVFEFGAVLYLASIFPGTLLPMSVYALARGACAMILSPAVGRYIDIGNRLQVVRLSIGKSMQIRQRRCTS
jgi:iron-regulated transporter 1